MKLSLTSIMLVAMTIPVAAQWLNHPTPGIPRTVDGKANLTAAAPRTVDGRPDLTGVWTGALSAHLARHPDASDVHPWAKEVARQRADNFFKDRPSFRCLPSGPEGFGGWKRIVQTPNLARRTMADGDESRRLSAGSGDHHSTLVNIQMKPTR
jgi:hypothetical protein